MILPLLTLLNKNLGKLLQLFALLFTFFNFWIKQIQFPMQIRRNSILIMSILTLVFVNSNVYSQYCATATTNVAITPTTSAQLTTSYSSGFRAFNFSAVAGRIYTFETCSQSSADTYLRLYDSGTGGNLITSDDDNCSTQSKIVWTCATNGTYSILLTNYTCASLSSATQINYYYVVNVGENCNNAQNLSTLTSPYSSTTANYLDDISACKTGGPDRIFYIDVPNGSIITFQETTNAYDEYEYIGYGSDCSNSTQIQCWDNDLLAATTWTNTTGSQQRVWYIQDSYAGESGNFTLSWSLTTPCTAPTLATTSAASSIGCTSATSGGNVTADGSCSVTERGICYNTSTAPTTSNTKVTSGTGIGSFSANLTGLTAGTTYYVRSYAINSSGTSYGAEINFTTSPLPGTPTAITPTAVCANAATTFTTSATGSPTSYTWTLPSGWTGSSTSSTISATPNATSGTISVTATNACGTSAATNTSITVTNLTPPTITNITGP
jgi:hypothetical protein